MPEQIGVFACGALFGLLLCGWPWHPRFSRYERRFSIGNCEPFPPARSGLALMTGPRFTEGRTIRGNGNGGPSTEKPQFPPPRIIREDFLP